MILVPVMLAYNVFQQRCLQFSTKRTERTLESRTNFVTRELRTFHFVNVNKMVSEVVFLGRLMVAQGARKSWADTAFEFNVSSEALLFLVSARTLVALEWKRGLIKVGTCISNLYINCTITK